MGFFRGVGRVFKPLVNFPRWMQLSRLRSYGGSVVDLGKSLFIPQQAEREESFDEAMQRLNLTEQDLLDRRKEFRRLLIIFSVIFILLVIYSVDLLLLGSLRGFLITFGIALIAMVQMFRYHLWLYQIKRRKLGIGFREWFKGAIMGKNK